MLPFFLYCVLKLIPSANASLNQSAWSRFRIFAYFKQRTFLFLRQGQYGITIAWSRCHGVPSGCYPLRSSVMIPVSAILKFTGYPSCRSVRNLCHTKWHSCNIRKYHVLPSPLGTQWLGEAQTQSSNDYTRGTKCVMRQIRVWSRGIGIVLRRTLRAHCWANVLENADCVGSHMYTRRQRC